MQNEVQALSIENLVNKAKQGDVESMIQAAKYYKNNCDDAKAHEYWAMAAAKGHTGAEYMAGMEYCFGLGGIKIDVPLGVKYLQNAADKNFPDAQFTLAVVCENIEESKLYLKENTPLNTPFFYYEKAAKQGHPAAQITLGDMYMKGEGVEHSLSQAIFWWGCAYLHDKNTARGNDEYAKERINSLYRQCNFNEIEIMKAKVENTLNEIRSQYSQYLHFSK